MGVPILFYMKKRLIILISILIPVLFSSNVYASFYPNDAKTVLYEVVGVREYDWINLPASGKLTVLGVSMQQSANSSTTTLSCGTTTIAHNYAKDLAFNPVSVVCSSLIHVSKTGNDSASILLTYVPYDLSTVPTNLVVMASVSYPTEPLLSSITSNSLDILPVYASMTAGDLGIILGLFALVMLQLLAMLWRKNKFS